MTAEEKRTILHRAAHELLWANNDEYPNGVPVYVLRAVIANLCDAAGIPFSTLQATAEGLKREMGA